MSRDQPLYGDPDLAAAYARISAANLCNARYERPALRDVVGSPAGLDLLDAGCAAGEHAAWFAERGARVTALDASPAMVALARERVRATARVMRHDLRDPLPFAPQSFDAVVSSLTLHYLERWQPALREFRRVLRPRGRLIFSTHHPFVTLNDGPYFALHEISERWSGFGDEAVPVHFFHRPLSQIVAEVVAAGFRISALHEPRLVDAPRADEPALTARLRDEPFFLIVDAAAEPAGAPPTGPASP
jgi:SAM-dependent methyltransferase